MNKIMRLFLLFLMMILFVNVLKADTILLIDGTYLVGKVIEWDAYHIIFKNSHGVFSIRKTQLVKMYITENLSEDIELKTELGHNISDKDIIGHFNSGKKGIPMGGIDRDELESGMIETEHGSKLNLAAGYYYTTGDFADILPYGLGFSFGFTQSLGRYLPDETALNAPSVYMETEFIFFSKGITEVKSFSLYAGPKWELNFPGGRWGKMEFHITPGATYLLITDEDYQSQSQTVSFKTSVGYEYHSWRFLTSVNVSYLYIFDKISPLQGLGISLSSAYKF